MSRLLPIGRLFVFCVAFSTLAVRPCRAATAEATGTYLGLIDADGPLAAGSIQIVLTRGGHGSLSIRLGNQPPVVAKVTVDGNGQIVVGRLPGGIALDLFVLPQADGSSTITGDILMPNSGAQIDLAPRATAAAASETAGRYTLQFDHAVAGADALMGVATVVVSPNGAARLVSGLSDGTVLSQGGTLDSNGNLLLFQGHPGTHSTFQMQANFAPDGSVAGTGKAVTATGTETPTIRGTRFLASANFGLPSSGTLSTFSAVDPTAVVTATGLTSPPRLPSELRVTGVVPANVRVDVRTGFATGDYTVTVAGKRVVRHLSGAVFQDRNATVGFVTQGTKRVGEFALTLDGLPVPGPASTAGTLTLGSNAPISHPGTTASTGVSGGTLSMGGNSGGSVVYSGGSTYYSGATFSLGSDASSIVTTVNTIPVFGLTLADFGIQTHPILVVPTVLSGAAASPISSGVLSGGTATLIRALPFEGATTLTSNSAALAQFYSTNQFQLDTASTSTAIPVSVAPVAGTP